MLTLTIGEAVVVVLGLLGIITVLVAAVLASNPRATRIVRTRVQCPLRGCPASVHLVRDTWTLRFVDVVRCSILNGYSTVICGKRCLGAPAAPRALPFAADADEPAGVPNARG